MSLSDHLAGTFSVSTVEIHFPVWKSIKKDVSSFILIARVPGIAQSESLDKLQTFLRARCVFYIEVSCLKLDIDIRVVIYTKPYS